MVIGTPSGHEVLNKIQRFILITFISNIPENKVYCGRYIRITSENTEVHLTKKGWSQLMDLASACIDREVIKYGSFQGELIEWPNKCFKYNQFVHLHT